jgi:hypothetical protein
MPLQLKLDAAGHVVVNDGKPVYVNDDGKEIAYDVNQASQKIKDLCNESKTHREALQAAEAKLKTFTGIDDPEEARKAINMCKNLDDKKLIDAGEVARIKEEVAKAANAQVVEAQARAEGLEKQLYEEKIGGRFARSQFIKDNLIIPADIAQSYFGRHFTMNEKGEIIAKDVAGNDIYSQLKPGSLADFDEALEILVGSYPNKGAIFRSNQATGGGTAPVNGGKQPVPASYADCKTEEERRLFIQSKAASN